MRLVDVDERTEETFFRCLHDEKPANPRVVEMRKRWYEAHKEKGLRARLLYSDSEEVVGLCQYMPIERSIFIGRDLMVILCMWVHGYEHLVGNQQGKGYGSFMLGAVEDDARRAGMKGVVAWGKDFPYWNPVSFYEHMSYSRVQRLGRDVLVWKAFEPGVEPPQFMQPRVQPSEGREKVKVMEMTCGWCSGGIECCLEARAAVAGLEGIVDYEEIDTFDFETRAGCGLSFDHVYVDGSPYKPDGPPFTSEELRGDILELYEAKARSQVQDRFRISDCSKGTPPRGAGL